MILSCRSTSEITQQPLARLVATKKKQLLQKKASVLLSEFLALVVRLKRSCAKNMREGFLCLPQINSKAKLRRSSGLNGAIISQQRSLQWSPALIGSKFITFDYQIQSLTW